LPKKTFQAAADANAQLIVQLKDNQPTLREKVEEAAASKPIDEAVTRDYGHNRDETRTVSVFDAKDVVKETEWKGLISSIVVVTRDVYKKNSKTGLFSRTHNVAYYLAAKSETATVFSEAIRKHWGIENRSHYPRDVTFNEDASRIRVKPGVMARLRSFAFNLLSLNKISSYAQDRFRAALGGLDRLLSLVAS
jgi:predicted transposase YbfD/YdcC